MNSLRTKPTACFFGEKTFKLSREAVTEGSPGQARSAKLLDQERYQSSPERAAEKAGVFPLLLLVLLLAVPTTSLAQSRKTQIGEINSYVAEINRFINRNPGKQLILANVAPYDSETSHWRRFNSEADAEKAGESYEIAYVWIRAGNVVAAKLLFTSPSGDWAHWIDYYFRENKVLVKIDARLNTFYGDASVLRQRYFNRRGVLIHSTRKFLDLYTQKQRPTADDFFDREVPVYRKVNKLPFYKLL